MLLKEQPPLDHALFRNAKIIGLAAAAARLGVELDRQMVALLEQAEVVEPAALVRCATCTLRLPRQTSPHWWRRPPRKPFKPSRWI